MKWTLIPAIVALFCGAVVTVIWLTSEELEEDESHIMQGQDGAIIMQQEPKSNGTRPMAEEHAGESGKPDKKKEKASEKKPPSVLGPGKCWEEGDQAVQAGECAAINCAHNWKSNYPLSADMFARTIPYTPNEDILRDVISRATQGGDLNVYVVGGSMTKGVSCASDHGKSDLDCSWQTRLGEWLRARFPRTNVQVVDMALGACNTVCHMHYMPFRIPHDIKGVDIVLIDTGAEDGSLVSEATKDVEGAGELKEWTELLVRYFLGMKAKPAVIYLEGIYRRNETSSFYVAEEHRKSTEAYGIPMVSYRHAIWPEAKLSAPEKELLYTLWDDDLHPSGKVHQLFADVIAHYLESVYLSLCEVNFNDILGKLLANAEKESNNVDLAVSMPLHDSNGAFMWRGAESMWDKFKLPGVPHFYMHAEFGGGLNVTIPHALSASDVSPEKSWDFIPGSGGTGGFSPTKFAPGSAVTFSVYCGSGNSTALLVIGYLRSNAGLGRVSVQIDGKSQGTLDGLYKPLAFPIIHYAEFEVPQKPNITLILSQLPKLKVKDDALRAKHDFRVDRISCA